MSIEKRVHPIPFRTRKLSASSPMILRIFTWESRPMPRLSLERLLFRSLSSFKACACRMCFEGRKIRSGFPSLFCFNSFGWLRRRKRAAKKIFLAAGLTGGTFQRQIENPPQHGKRLKRKIPRRQAAAGRLSGDFRKIPRASPQHPQHRAFLSGKMPASARLLLGMAGCIFRRKYSRSGGVGWMK